MEKIIKYSEYIKLNEDGDGGGGTAFATANINGMGNITTAQVGSLPGSVWQGGSGTVGSGDRAAYDMGDRFDKLDRKKSKKSKKGNKNNKPKVFTKFSDFVLNGPKK
jgi:hypothetical protein